ncbi:MAG: helix-turn-helix transcriptional regulator [Desulfonatronovibrio sp.]
MIGICFTHGLFTRTFPAALAITAVTTVIFPNFPEYWVILTIIVGSSSAWIMVKAGTLLKYSPYPLLNSAIGLTLGNAGVFLLAVLPVENAINPIIALCLMPSIARAIPFETDNYRVPIKKYLFLVFVFYLVSGQMYGYLDVMYSATAMLPGIEVIFYILTVAAGAALLRVNPGAALAFGIALSMLSLSLLQSTEPAHINASMYLKQAAKGFIDIFVFSIMLSHANPIFAFGVVSGSICLGLTLGALISFFLSGFVLYTIVIGNIALAGTIIIFFFVHQMQIRETPDPKTLHHRDLENLVKHPYNELIPTGPDVDFDMEQVVPRPLLGKLSDRERKVLEMVLLKKMIFREVAVETGISESSVKTYMHRIYEKAGVKNKKGLQELVFTSKKN